MNKYHAKKTVIDGITFDSGREAKRYKELKLLELAGEISGLKLQVKYVLTDSNELFRASTYTLDFEYLTKDGHKVYEDSKGMRKGEAYSLFKLKQKIMYEKYGIYIKEV